MKLNFLKCLPVALAGLFIGNVASAQSTTSSTTPFRAWSVGLNAGTTIPISPLGGHNDYSHWETGFSYGLYIKKQITPSFALRLDGFRGATKGDNVQPFNNGATVTSPFGTFRTDINYAGSLSAVMNVFNWSMFKQQNNAQFFVSAGGGFTNFTTTTTATTGGAAVENPTVTKINIPVGLGVKFRLTEAMNLDIGATMNYLDADNFDGRFANGNDKYTYGYAGLEFALGKGKQLAFYSPTAATYDEAIAAKNAANALKSDLDAQKAENARLRSEMGDLLKDSDNDGVADKLDKCAGTPAGTVVDGSGCPLKVPAPQVTERVIVTEADRKVVADAISNLEFDLGKDIDEAANDVRDKVSQAARNLPKDIDGLPTVTKADANSDAIISMTVQSDKRGVTDLSDFAENVIADRIQTIPGVSSVQIQGQRKYAMRIRIDPNKLSSYGLTSQDIVTALNNENVELPSGKLTGATTELTVKTWGYSNQSFWYV